MAKKQKQGPAGYYAYQNKLGFIVVTLAVALCVFLAYENAYLDGMQIVEQPVKLGSGAQPVTFNLERPGLPHSIKLISPELAPLRCLLTAPDGGLYASLAAGTRRE